MRSDGRCADCATFLVVTVNHFADEASILPMAIQRIALKLLIGVVWTHTVIFWLERIASAIMPPF